MQVQQVSSPSGEPSDGRDFWRRSVARLTPALVTGGLFSAVLAYSHRNLIYLRANPRMVLQPLLLQQGFLQYSNIADEHAPLLPQLLAWLMPAFNNDALQTMQFAHAGLVFLAVLGSVTWAYLKYDRWAAVATGAWFVAWSAVGGFWALWYDLALCPVYLFVFFVLDAAVPATIQKTMVRALVVGIAGGLGMLVKQQAILLVGLSLAWMMFRGIVGRVSVRSLAVQALCMLAGVALPVLAYAAFFARSGGSLEDLWYWTVIFNFTSDYSKLGLSLLSAAGINQLLPAVWLLLPLLLGQIRISGSQRPTDYGTRLLVLLFLVIAGLMQYPRYSLMHWATAAPFIAIGSGIVCRDIYRAVSQAPGAAILNRSLYAAVVLLWLAGIFTVYLPQLGNTKRLMIEYDNVVPLADEIRSRDLVPGSMVVFPDNEAISNLYYLLNKTPPRFWLMTYPWFMNDFTVAKWIDALEREQTQYAILLEGQFDWTSNPAALAYLKAHYQVVDTLSWENNPVRIMSRLGSGAR